VRGDDLRVTLHLSNGTEHCIGECDLKIHEFAPTNPKGTLSWANMSWIPSYNRALEYGDVIKLVGVANTFRIRLS
jgi:hypothetical protein